MNEFEYLTTRPYEPYKKDGGVAYADSHLSDEELTKALYEYGWEIDDAFGLNTQGKINLLAESEDYMADVRRLPGVLDEHKCLDYLKYGPYGRGIILLGYTGSKACGANVDGSDMDLTCIRHNTVYELLGLGSLPRFANPKSQQDIYEDGDLKIDICKYTLTKYVDMLVNGSPQSFFILGLRPEDYLIIGGSGRTLLGYSGIFLSKKVWYSFNGYNLDLFDKMRQIEISTTERKEKRDTYLKYAYQLIHGYRIATDMLLKKEIITYKEEEAELLRKIRTGGMLDETGTLTTEFYNINHEYKRKFDESLKTTTLPETPNMKEVEYLTIQLNIEAVNMYSKEEIL